MTITKKRTYKRKTSTRGKAKPTRSVRRVATAPRSAEETKYCTANFLIDNWSDIQGMRTSTQTYALDNAAVTYSTDTVCWHTSHGVPLVNIESGTQYNQRIGNKVTTKYLT